MATSGINYYQLTRDQLLTASLRKLGVLAEGQVPSAQNLADASMMLNTTIAEFRSKGMMLWVRKEYTFTPITKTYTIGVGMTLNTPFPIQLNQAVRYDTGAKIDMELLARTDFNILPASSTGIPIKISYTPAINFGTLEFWPIPDSTNTSTVTLVYQRPFEYSLSAGDTLDFPEEWYNAIIYRVAQLVAPEWGIPLSDRTMLVQEAASYLAGALENGQDIGSFYIQPERPY